MKTKKKKRKNNYFKYNPNKRMNFLIIILFFLFVIIISRLCFLTINMNHYYKMILNKETNNVVYKDTSPRGRIYDRNNKLLVDNISVKKIYYLKNKNINESDEIKLAYEVSKHLNLDYDKLNIRNLKEFYLSLYPEKGNKLITENEYNLYNNRKLTYNELYEYKIDRITKDDLSVFNEDDKKCAYLYYLMNKGYKTDEKTIKIKDVTEEEYAYINENIENLKGFNTKLDWERVYLYGDTLRNIFGSVSTEETGIPYEKKTYYLNKGYLLNDRVGISGLEEYYEDILKGEKSTYQILDDGSFKLIKEGKKGKDIVLSIDIDLQLKVEEILKYEVLNVKKEANTKFYNRSFVIIQEPSTGEILTLAGKQVLKNSLGKYEIYDYSVGNITSTVTPGSVVKGASHTVGYNTKVIKFGTVMEDSCIKFLNMPRKCSWTNLGMINDLEALKYSSNIYQFKIAMMVGKFKYKYNSYLDLDLKTFDIYRKTFYQYGLGVKTGIDFPIEEDGYKGGSYASDLLLNYAIGQYDTYTPLQLSQYISTIANNGTRVKTRFLKGILTEDNILLEETPVILNKVDTKEEYIKRIQEGFKLVMTPSGTGYDFMGNSPRPAGKTGTSESFVDDNNDGIYDHPTMSNNFIGYAPSNKPVMSITVSSPDVQDILSGSFKSNVNYRISKKCSNAYFNLYDVNGKRK